METFENILSRMLDCFGNKDYKIEYYRKLQGYGLTASDFENYEDCSRRVFSHWRKFLLERKFIRTPKVKRKESKDTFKRSSKNLPHTITPLGICYYCSTLEKISERKGEKIIRFLSQYSTYELNTDWKKICEIIGNEKAHEVLKKVCDSIEITDSKEKTKVDFNYRTRGRVNYELYKYTIKNKKIVLQWSEEGFTNIEDDDFHEDLAYFILDSFCYSIIEECNYKIRGKSGLLSLENITLEEKENIKKPMKKWEKILEDIPVQVHIIASNFVGQYIYGTIRHEQRMAGAIANNFYQKIAPKQGFEYVDKDGKPFQLFRDLDSN